VNPRTKIDDRTVAVLGTGIMGDAIARRLLGAGFRVRAWNRTREKAEPLADRGALVAWSASGAAAESGIVITLLADGDAVLEVMEGTINSMERDAIWLQMSTIGIPATERCVRLAQRAGIAFVDAPVSGTKKPAEEGKLVVLASGHFGAIHRCDAVFDVIAQTVHKLGPAGAGTRMKLVVNAWLLGMMGALAEAIALAEATGADALRFLDVIEGGPIGPAYARLKGAMMVEGKYPTSFPLELAAKDAALVVEAAHRAGLPLPVVEAVRATLEAGDRSGRADDDMAAIVEAVRAGRRQTPGYP
jgi:3-hydroxyisobutyrate dehydrogenase